MQKYLIVIVFIVLFIANMAIAQQQVRKDEINGFVYYYYVSQDYNSNRAYPLIIGFHESGGSGKAFIRYWLTPADKKGYIIVCPDARAKKYWDFNESKDVFALIDALRQRYNIDSSRVYITGFSAGANFTYYLALRYPKYFKKAASYAGTFKNLEKDLRLEGRPRPIPIFILHGSMDNMADISQSRYARDRLTGYGYPVRYREFSGTDHVYNEGIAWVIIDWFGKER